MNPTNQTRNVPEKKFGPYAGGVGVAIWANRIETDDGPRIVRSVTINPRRYRDRESGEWKNSSSYGLNDVHLLLFALEQAREFMLMQPLPETHATVTDSDPIPY